MLSSLIVLVQALLQAEPSLPRTLSHCVKIELACRHVPSLVFSQQLVKNPMIELTRLKGKSSPHECLSHHIKELTKCKTHENSSVSMVLSPGYM